MIMMAVEPISDYQLEFENFNQKLAQNLKTLQKVVDTTLNQVILNTQQEQDIANKTKGEIAELQKKIESIRQNVGSICTDKDRAGREKQKLQQEYDQLNLLINEKVHEKEELKEIFSQREQSIKTKEQQIEFNERKHQERISNMEKGMLLYQTHLGLKIQRTNHNALVFIYTQINRSDPNKEFVLELTLEGDRYKLLRCSPPIPDFCELEERLNTTNNLSGFIVRIRKLFQELDAQT